MAQDAQLLLKVGLDLSTFRNQLATLGQAAAGYNLPIKIKFDRIAVQNELNALGVNIKRRTYKLEVTTNIKAETDNARVLAKGLAELGKAGQQMRGMAGRAATGAEASTVDAAKFQAMVNRATKPALEALYQGMAKAKIPMAEVGGRTVDELKKSIISGIPGITQDIANGMTKGLENLKESGRKGARFVIDSFKDAAGIASPSKVFKQLGQFSAEGLEDGFLEGLRDFKGKAVSEIRKIVALMRMELATLGGAASSAVAVAGGGVRGAGRGGTQYMSPIGPLPHGSREPWAYNQGAYRYEPYMAQPNQFRGAGVRPMASRYPFSPMPGVMATTESASMFGMARPALPAAGMSSAAGMRQAELFAREAAARARSAERNAAVLMESTLASRVSGQVPLGRGGFPQLPSGSGGALALRNAGIGGGVGGGGGGGGFGGLSGAGSFGRAMGGINLPGAGLIREIGGEFAFATKQVLLFGQAYKLLGFAQDFPAQVGQAVGELQSFRNTLKAISPTAQEAAASNDFILSTVDKYNVPLQSARDGFTKLYASMAPAGFDGGEIRDLFLGISKAAATFGMSSDKVDRVTYAFAQMASKGQVMSEELKGQLGDVLPGALGIFAEAAGFKGPQAIEKFSKALEDGAFKGDAMRALIKNVTIGLNREFGPGAEGAAKTYQGVMTRMANATKLFYETFEPLAVGFLNSVVLPITSGIKTMTDGFNAFFSGTKAKTAGGAALAQELNKLRPAFEGIAANIKQIVPLLQTFGSFAVSVGQTMLQIAGNPFVGYLAQIYLTLLPITTALRILNLQALIPLIGSFLRAIPAFVSFNAAMATGASTNKALQLSMQLTGQTAAITAGKIRLVSAALGTMGNIAIVAGIGVLIERFMMMKSAIDGVRQSTQQMLASISSMANSGAVKDLENIGKDLKKQRDTFVQLQSLVAFNPRQRLTEEGAKKFEEVGMGAFVKRDVFGKPYIGDFVRASKIIEEKLQSLDKQSAKVVEKLPLAIKIAASAAKQAGAEQKEQKIDLSGGDDKAVAKEASAYNQLLQEQLQKQNEINAIGKDELSQLEAKRVLAAQLLKLRLDEINRTQTGRVRDLARSNEILEYKKIVAETDEEWKNVTKEISEAATKAQELFDKIYKQDTPEMTPLQKALGDIKKETIDNIQAIDELLNYANKRVGARPEYKSLVTSLTQMRKERAGMTPAKVTAAGGVRVTRDIVKDLSAGLETGAQAFAPSTTLAGVQAKLGPDWMQLSSQRQAEITQLAERVDLMKPFIDMAQAIKASREELQKLVDARYQIVPMAQAIGSAFGESFKEIASGSVTAQQALANFFQSVGSSFLDMAGRMIAKWMEMQIIGLATSLIPGMGGFFGGGARVGQSVSLPSGVGIGAGGGILQNPMGQGYGTLGPNFGIRQFADGGLVTGPTMGLIGEGRFNEAIVPLPNGKSIPVELGGAAGNQIVSNITVNVNNGQMQSNGGANSTELTRKLEGAVKQVIIGELRPGGVLSGRG